MAPMRTLQGIGNPLRVGKEVTQVVPDDVIELLGRAVPGRTALVMLCVQGEGRTAAYRGAMAMFRRPRKAGRLAHPTTDQRP